MSDGTGSMFVVKTLFAFQFSIKGIMTARELLQEINMVECEVWTVQTLLTTPSLLCGMHKH